MNLHCCVTGTDTHVGKTQVMELLCNGLRQLNRRVWVHKPVACGDWQDDQAEDARRLVSIADPDQDPLLVCPLQFPTAASPHIAARIAQTQTSWQDMSTCIRQLMGDHDLLVEGAGGILAPLSSDLGNITDICLDLHLPCLLVTRPHLGTLNHTQLTVHEAQRRGLQLSGLVINYHSPDIDVNDPAISSVKQELEHLCQLPVLAEIPYQQQSTNSTQELAKTLAERLLTTHAGT